MKVLCKECGATFTVKKGEPHGFICSSKCAAAELKHVLDDFKAMIRVS